MKLAVITGGAGGLGRAITERLTAKGWTVAVLDIPSDELDACASDFVQTYACDVTDMAAVSSVCQQIEQRNSTVDLVIYNAGITQIGMFAETPIAAHRRVFEINYFGAVNVAACLLLAVRRSGGQHVAISSVAGFAPLHRRCAYSASKHALEGFFRTLREEEREFGVGVTIAMPSFVATNIGKPQKQDGGIARPGSAVDGIDYMSGEAAAKIILTGVEARKETIPVGRVARMSWFINRLAPRLYARLMMRSIRQGTEG